MYPTAPQDVELGAALLVVLVATVVVVIEFPEKHEKSNRVEAREGFSPGCNGTKISEIGTSKNVHCNPPRVRSVAKLMHPVLWNFVQSLRQDEGGLAGAWRVKKIMCELWRSNSP
jgi:hypothetical protein